MQSLLNCNISRKHSGSKKLFKCPLPYCLVFQYFAKPLEKSAEDTVQIEIAHRKLLQTYGQNDALRFSGCREVKDWSLKYILDLCEVFVQP